MKNKFSNTTLFLFLLLFNGQLSASNEYFNEGINFYKQKEFEKAKFKFEQDIVYNPKETGFLMTGKNLGNITMNGKLMFVYQAFLAFKIWHKLKPDINEEVLKLLD